MNESDVHRIERELSVSLPSEYRDLLLHFPIRYDAGTSTGPLWDNADAIIARNTELRSERKSLGVAYMPLPANYLFVGDDGGGWQNLIDLTDDPPVVSIMEYENVERISPALTDDGKTQTLSVWFHDHLLELARDGIDINSADAPSYNLGWGCLLGILGLCLAAALAISLMVAGIQYVTGK